MSFIFPAIAVFAALAVSARAQTDFCPGEDLEYLVALQCGEDAPVTLNCIPESLSGEVCSLPDTLWAQGVCEQAVGKLVEPTLIDSITGCYSTDLDNGPLSRLGIDTASPFFCLNFPAEVPDSFFSDLVSSDSFEGPDPLADWTLDISSDYSETGETAIEVVCEGSVAPSPYDYTLTFTDTIDEAADGSCAARVLAGCDIQEGSPGAYGFDYYEVRLGGTNTLSREFRVLNRGCTPGMMSYELKFAVAWDTDEFCTTSTYVPGPDYTYAAVPVEPYAFFDDTAEVRVAIGGNVIVAAAFSVCDGDSAAFQEVTVDLGEFAIGSIVEPVISVAVTNDQDCAFSSFAVIDNIRIMPKA